MDLDYDSTDYTGEIIYDDKPEAQGEGNGDGDEWGPGDAGNGEEGDDPSYQEEQPLMRIPIGSKTYYTLTLFRLSDELYNYCKAQYLIDFNMLSNFGVTPPNFTYSNIYGGLGVVGGLSYATSDSLLAPGSQEPQMPSLWDLLQMMQ
jgi:hypothetical protein